MHHSIADIDRLYMKWKGGGTAQLQIKVTYKAEIINTAEYFNTKYIEDQFMNKVMKALNQIRIQQLKWQQRL